MIKCVLPNDNELGVLLGWMGIEGSVMLEELNLLLSGDVLITEEYDTPFCYKESQFVFLLRS